MKASASTIRVTPPPGIAAALAKHAVVSDRAVLVGNRAGVVEWANEAWTRITGFPLDATLRKPIAHFLGEADIELELVDFVGQRFLEGRACTIEFPFDTFDERSIWVHLEVQPIRNEIGEIVEFVAVATDETERRAQDLAAEGARADRAGSPAEPDEATSSGRLWKGAVDRIALEDAARSACELHFRSPNPTVGFDLAFDPIPRMVSGNPLLMTDLIGQLVESGVEGVRGGWGTVTLMSGRTQAGRGHVSQAYPLVTRSRALARAAWNFLEIHDSGPALDPADLQAARRATEGREPRVRRLAVASELARLLGGSLQIDSVPGCGTQALLLLPPAE